MASMGERDVLRRCMLMCIPSGDGQCMNISRPLLRKRHVQAPWGVRRCATFVIYLREQCQSNDPNVNKSPRIARSMGQACVLMSVPPP